jgi:hypothetical protein
MSEIVGQRAGVMPIIRKLIASGMPQHVGMHCEGYDRVRCFVILLALMSVLARKRHIDTLLSE